ncbi:hypothetical protein [Caballeronia sp. LZ035]|uniref:hypothetical protein n=1 Tax=Caballeronia sp. LZ035 TaxID=3038568 RepID=UPI00285C9EB1|nr:hypothetical protein [Caballeronia sp. LZ035]MDR5755618.1 hypothetical protein [Caballeronia sp. LZ035]
MTSDPIRVGDLEFHIAVQPLRGGGYTYAVVEVHHNGREIIEKQHNSALRFETENDAHDGGMMDARRRAAKVGG